MGGGNFKRKHLVVKLKQKDGKLLVIFSNTILTLSIRYKQQLAFNALEEAEIK